MATTELKTIDAAVTTTAAVAAPAKRKSLRKPAVKKDAAPAPDAKVEAKTTTAPVEDTAAADKAAAFFKQAEAKLAGKGITVDTTPVTTAKPKADKKAGKKESSSIKTETVTVKAAPKFVARKAEAGAKVHAINPSVRPGSGRLLFAHTHAALTALGMLSVERHTVKQANLLALIGGTAVGYHIGQRNLEEVATGYRLTVLGYNKFSQRLTEGKFSVDDATGYLSAMLDGTPNDKLHVKAKDVYVAFTA